MTPFESLHYAGRQGARVAWYMGHYFASRRFRAAKPAEERKSAGGKGPGRNFIFEQMGNLFARDLANVAKGHYPMPRDRDGTLRQVIETSRRYFADLPAAAERKAQGQGAEVYSAELAEKFPAYFLQNFHFQTGGYLTEESAKLYDMQVEVLFSGTANAMRRQCLVPIAEYLRHKDQRLMALLDVACGTGRFLRFAREAFPRLAATGIDLSEAYIEEACQHVQPYKVEFRYGAAETLPFADQSFDIVTSIYLFHEVPPAIRRAIAVEFARVLKPGGLLVFMDSLQPGDMPEVDAMLEAFPVNFHEPYYPSYLREDLTNVFAQAGFKDVRAEPIFLSKLVTATKPDLA
ncbi:methyltransferase domain-containing protein [Taklimakanibacter lacteus]|uniref:methyltransferase domain-containing protein n=1 Tax=Taklimakanibacter lacteus TaxID=2268456 RepID=UPI000E66C13B